MRLARAILGTGFAMLCIASALWFTGCQPVTIVSNPSPTVTTISPSVVVAGGPAFVLTVNGTGFVAGSIINFGSATPTTFVSSTQLTAAIPAAAIASNGDVNVAVTNPAPGGGTSNSADLIIGSGPNAIPTITFLDPSCAPVGAQAFTLAVSGTDFGPSSVTHWNGADRPTALLSSGLLVAQISASDIATAGTADVTVSNGGGNSNSSTLTIAAGGDGPKSIAVDPTGKFAYVANEGCPDDFDGSVSMYTIDSTTGALTSIGLPIDSGDFGGQSVAVDPSGKFAYVANWGEGDTLGSVSAYDINSATGALTFTRTAGAPCGPPPSPGACAPWSVAVHPSGKFGYVANEGGLAPTSVSAYAIDATKGGLTLIGTWAVAGRAVSVAVDPTGKFLYAAAQSDPPGSPGNISVYTINSTTGALTSVGTIATGTDPASATVDPMDKFLYAVNSGSNNISMYTIDSTTGELTSIGLVAAGTSPVAVAVDPTGKFAYVADSTSNDVSMYTIDTTTGALTFTGVISAGLSPSSIAIHPSGNFAYVTNSGSNNISMYSVNSTTGALTLIGTIGT